MKNSIAGITSALLLAFAACLSGCSQDLDFDVHTNEDLAIASYTWDSWLDPSRGEARETYGDFVYNIMGNWKAKAVVTLYMDGTCRAEGSYYNGGSYEINDTGTWSVRDMYGTLENGTIHLPNFRLMGYNTIQDPGTDWWIQVIDGNKIVGITGPHSDELYVAPTALTTIADTGTEDTYDYTGQPYTTVTFVANPACNAPDIRYATFVVHDNKVKGLLEAGKKDTSEGFGTGGMQAFVVFDLPDVNLSSGVIEVTPESFSGTDKDGNKCTYTGTDGAETTSYDASTHAGTGPKHTYYLVWQRRRYDVRITQITTNLDPSTLASIESFAFAGNDEATGTQIKSAAFNVADGKVSATLTLGYGVEVTTDSVDLPATTETSGTLTFTVTNGQYATAAPSVTSDMTYTATWSREGLNATSATVSQITGGSPVAMISMFTFNTNSAATGTQVKNASFSNRVTLNDDGTGGTVLSTFTFGDGTKTDTESAALPGIDETRGTLTLKTMPYLKSGSNYYSYTKSDNILTLRAKVNTRGNGLTAFTSSVTATDVPLELSSTDGKTYTGTGTYKASGATDDTSVTVTVTFNDGGSAEIKVGDTTLSSSTYNESTTEYTLTWYRADSTVTQATVDKIEGGTAAQSSGS